MTKEQIVENTLEYQSGVKTMLAKETKPNPGAFLILLRHNPRVAELDFLYSWLSSWKIWDQLLCISSDRKPH
jgi:hypothetical protein